MSYVIPLFIAIIIIYSLSKKSPIYESFILGAKEGVGTLADIFPALLGIMVSVSMLRASGALDALLGLLSPVLDKIGIAEDVLLLGLMRPISGSGSIGILSEILNIHGPDSFSGRLASVMMGSTETTFYTLTVYFAKTKVKYTKRVIPAAVFGDIVGLLASFFVCKIFF